MAAPGHRADIEAKIRSIANRLVRGKSARRTRTVWLSRIRTIVAVVGSTLTSIGLTNPLIALAAGREQSITATFSAWGGLPKYVSFVGVTIFLISAVLLALYTQAKIDEKATQSRAVADMFDRLEVKFEGVLDWREPIQQLNVFLEEAKTLESNNYHVMPRGDGYQNMIDDYVAKTIKQYSENWGDAPPESERKEKKK
jgi:hypothetical protein